MRIKCILVVGVNATSKPTIKIINYAFVNPSTTIVIGFAGLQSLPPILTNTISIGVMIYYNDISSSTYLYIPTPIITLATTSNDTLIKSTKWISGWNINASYSGANIVLKPTIFTLSIIVPYCYNYNVSYNSSRPQNLTCYNYYAWPSMTTSYFWYT